MKALVLAFTRNIVFANIVLLFFVVGGVLAAKSMIRETFPEFSLEMINISVLWPGADPEEVEEGIVRKIEEAIQGIEGIKQFNGTAAENVGSVLVEVDERYDVNYVRERVRNAVDAISTFPVDAEKAVTEEILFREEVMMVALSGAELSERDLKEWAERVKEEIRLMPEVSQVRILGGREYEIGIEISEERLREYGMTFAQVAEAVRSSSLNLSGGIMRTQGEEIRLRTVERKYTGAELAQIVVLARPQGEVITLDRIARIRDGFTEDVILSRFNGKPTITVTILKTSDEDALAIDAAVKDYVARKAAQLPAGLTMEIWGETSHILQQRINLLLRNGLIGLCLVFALLWMFLDFRLSFWAGMGMPVSILGALIIMWLIGATINMISLFGLIMVLGIIVDDAIVVGEAIYVHRKNGAGPVQAAVEGVMEVGLPVLAAVCTTIVAFLPLLYIGGVMGKFIAILPIVVIACLAISLVECLIILPAHLSRLPDPNVQHTHGHPIARAGRRFHRFTNHGLEWFVAHIYAPFIKRVLHFRYISLSAAIAVLIVTGGVLQSGILKFEFFPDLDSEVMSTTVEFPNGTPFAITEEAVRRVEAAAQRVEAQTPTITGEPLIVNTFSIVGQTVSDALERPRIGSNVGTVRVQMLPTERRGIHSDALMVAWEREIGQIPGVTALTIAGMSAGPPGAPIEIWLQGHQMDEIHAASAAIQARLSQYEGVYQIQDDFRLGKNEITLRLKPEARTLGLTVSDLARQVHAGYFGEEAVRLQRGRDDIRVRVRYPEAERSQIAEFERIRIRTPQGREVPLMSVAELSYGPGYANINRTDGMRRVSVTAEVDNTKANAAEIVAELGSTFFQQLREEYPRVMVSFQGEQKKVRESLGGLTISYPLTLIGMYIIIATIFRSYIQPMLIMMAVPFGFIGAVAGHLLLGYPISFMSMMGIVAMSGVVVNDAIVLIEAINDNLARGVSFLESVRRGGARRFRAVFLTSLTTIGGLTPLIMERDLQAKFLVPMAVAISGGVAFATVVTLVLIPCMLAILNDLRCVAYWARTRRWPTREEVEPATYRNLDMLSAVPAAPAEEAATTA